MNEFQQAGLLLILTVSVILQFYAAFIAFRLKGLSRNHPSWTVISIAMILMALRQAVMFFHLTGGGAAHPADLYAEITALLISLLLAAGLISIAPLMRRLYSAPAESRAAIPGEFLSGEFFEKNTSGIGVYEATDKGREFIIRDINPAAERIEKIARQHAAGRRLTEVFPGIEQFGLLDVMRRVWKTGRSESFPLHYYQDDRISGWRDNFVYRCSGGEVVTVYNDVTAQMHMKEELELRERKFRMLFELAPLPYQSLDGEGRILEVNPAWIRLAGFDRTSATGRPFSELLDRTGRRHFQECLDALKTGGSVAAVTLELRRDDGVLRNIEMDALASRSRTGEVEQVYCMLREKSGQTAEPDMKSNAEKQARRLAMEMLDSERRELQRQRISMFGELTAGMAHEFNEPLTAARSAVSLIREDLSPVNPHYEFAEMASRELACIADMVERMYRFHEPVAQNCEPVNINALLDNTLVLVRSEMRTRRIRLQDERTKTVPVIMLPPGAVMLTLINPVKNSIAAMSSDGVLTLRTGQAGQGGVFVEIEDNGTGIPPEFLPHLFEPFTSFRHRGAEHGGTGLGMAMVRRILDALGGTITIRSRSGEGTCVRMVLPVEMKTDLQGV
ncbi:MAG: ATP-binding protein [Kiritimatiellales bacterium]|jgi:PAS domain S-box-containing protein